MQIFTDSFFVYTSTMAKKRKPHKSKRSHAWGFFLVALIVIVAVAAYSYRTNPEFKQKADEVSQTVAHEINEVTENLENLLGTDVTSEESEKITEQKLIALPAGLENPICAAAHHGSDHEIRHFAHYSLCYRESYEQAEWSAYCLTEEELAKNANRSNDFRPDPEISTGSASLADYRKSGYDRGHLSPAADFAFDENAMSETFYMSNMSPQAGSFNRGIWKNLEAQVREWAGIFGRVYVVSGPILEKNAGEYKTIGENAVAVPEFYYKVLLAPLYADEADKTTPEDAESVLALAFVFPNEKCEEPLDFYETTVDEVEKRTGLDFFSLLEDSVEDEAESQLRRLQ